MILFGSNMFVLIISVCCFCCYHEHCLQSVWEDSCFSQKTLIKGIDENFKSHSHKDTSLTFKETNRKDTSCRMKLFKKLYTC